MILVHCDSSMAGNMIHLEGLQKELSENELADIFSAVFFPYIQH
jgi:hypothetical protein